MIQTFLFHRVIRPRPLHPFRLLDLRSLFRRYNITCRILQKAFLVVRLRSHILVRQIPRKMDLLLLRQDALPIRAHRPIVLRTFYQDTNMAMLLIISSRVVIRNPSPLVRKFRSPSLQNALAPYKASLPMAEITTVRILYWLIALRIQVLRSPRRISFLLIPLTLKP